MTILQHPLNIKLGTLMSRPLSIADCSCNQTDPIAIGDILSYWNYWPPMITEYDEGLVSCYHVDVNQVYSDVLWNQRMTENSVNVCVVMIQQGKGILGSIRCSLAGKSGCLYSSIS
jgi:hypothetical protein